MTVATEIIEASRAEMLEYARGLLEADGGAVDDDRWRDLVVIPDREIMFAEVAASGATVAAQKAAEEHDHTMGDTVLSWLGVRVIEAAQRRVPARALKICLLIDDTAPDGPVDRAAALEGFRRAWAAETAARRASTEAASAAALARQVADQARQRHFSALVPDADEEGEPDDYTELLDATRRYVDALSARSAVDLAIVKVCELFDRYQTAKAPLHHKDFAEREEEEARDRLRAVRARLMGGSAGL